jgi:uncharacterized membrane protein YfcA
LIFDAAVLLAATLAGAVAAVSARALVRALRRIPERVFRPSVSVLITALGAYMLATAVYEGPRHERTAAARRSSEPSDVQSMVTLLRP